MASIVAQRLVAQTVTPNLINGVFIIDKTNHYNVTNNNNANGNSNQNNNNNSSNNDDDEQDGNGLITGYGVAAYFTNTPSSAIATTAFSKAGNVKFNDESLDYNSTKKFYSKTEDDDDAITEQHWKVSGFNTIPAMNFIYSGTFPSFNINQTMVGNTLKKTDTLFVSINNILNADSIRITVNDNNNASNKHYIALQAPNYANKYYLTPSMFSPLVIGTNAVVKIEAINYNYQTVAGKKYLFRNMFSFVKTGITIIN